MSNCKFTDDSELSVRRTMHKLSLEGNPEKLANYYSEHAQAIDNYVESTGKDASALALLKAIQSEHTNKNARILDVGAGTGLVGSKLKEHGFEDIDAMDFAQGMLDFAKSKGIYKNYICDSVQPESKTQIADNTYDVLCMCGLMVPGHVSLDAIPELVRMTKRGGIVVFNIPEYSLKTYPELREDVVEARLQSFVDDGILNKWSKQFGINFSSSGETCNIYIATKAN